MDVSRLGILGGTFDPIHYGHLVAAQEAASALRLDRVLFIPTREPPHKRGEPVLAVEHRLEIVRRGISGNPRFELSTIEIERPGPSYTVDTLRELRRLYPDGELHFIVGMDLLADLPTWHNPGGIVQLAVIVAVTRRGWEAVDLGWLEAAVPEAAGRVQVLPIPGLDISSTEVRERIAAGRPIRYLVPDGVIGYIQEQGLYRGREPAIDPGPGPAP